MNIYIEDGEAKPDIAVGTSPPAGFTISADPTIDWDKYAAQLVGSQVVKVSEIRTEIKAEYTSITWALGSAAQKSIWSKWGAATKAERDTIDSAAVQEANAVYISGLLNIVRVEEAKADYVTATKDAEPADIDTEIQDFEQGGNTIITSGAGTKYLSDDGTYKVVAGGGGGQATISIHAEAMMANAAGRTFLGTNSQSFLSFSGTGTVDDAGGSFTIPADYGSGLKFAAYFCMDGNDTDQMRIAINIIQSGDLGKAYNEASVDETLELLDNAQNTTAWLAQKMAAVSSGLTWNPGEVCMFELERDPGHANDTSNKTLYLSHLEIEYTKA